MNKAERHYIKTLNMCALYAGGRRKSRKLAKASKGRIPARKAAKLWKDSLAFRTFVKMANHGLLYGAKPDLVVHDELQYGIDPLQALNSDFSQVEKFTSHWFLTH